MDIVSAPEVSDEARYFIETHGGSLSPEQLYEHLDQIRKDESLRDGVKQRTIEDILREYIASDVSFLSDWCELIISRGEVASHAFTVKSIFVRYLRAKGQENSDWQVGYGLLRRLFDQNVTDDASKYFGAFADGIMTSLSAYRSVHESIRLISLGRWAERQWVADQAPSSVTPL